MSKEDKPRPGDIIPLFNYFMVIFDKWSSVAIVIHAIILFNLFNILFLH